MYTALLADLRFGSLYKSRVLLSLRLLYRLLSALRQHRNFSVVKFTILLKSLPYTHPLKANFYCGATCPQSLGQSRVSATDVDDWRTQNHVFEDVTVTYSTGGYDFGTGHRKDSGDAGLATAIFKS